VGATKAIAAVRGAAQQSLRRSRVKRREVVNACVGLAALNVAHDLRIMAPSIATLGLARSTDVVHDSLIALVGANAGVKGAVLIAGTGTVAAGINHGGRLVRVGGWGYAIDDRGSAYQVGREAIRAMFQALDGRARDTSLTKSICARFGVSDAESVHTLIYEGSLGVEEIAGLSSVVSKTARQGDYVAKQILQDAAESLSAQLVALNRKLGVTERTVSVRTVGGLFDAGVVLVRPLRKFLKKSGVRVSLLPALLPPVAGALIIAADTTNPEKSNVFVRRLMRQRRRLIAAGQSKSRM
jgi:N-acetylglucosamine kinase-like BadF-type ATPase